MKFQYYIILCLVTLSLAALPAAETNAGPVSVEHRLREIDLKLALNQYEQIQKQLLDLRLQQELLDTEDLPDEERKKQAARIQKRDTVLARQAQLTRARVLQFGTDSTVQTK